MLCHLDLIRHRDLFSVVSAMKGRGGDRLLRNVVGVGCWLLAVGCWFHAGLCAGRNLWAEKRAKFHRLGIDHGEDGIGLRQT